MPIKKISHRGGNSFEFPHPKEEYWKLLKNRKWYATRDAILKRDDKLCCRCAENGITEVATEVHHIVKVNDNPDLCYEESNLVSLCSECHREVEGTNYRPDKFNELYN